MFTVRSVFNHEEIRTVSYSVQLTSELRPVRVNEALTPRLSHMANTGIA
jgi:hypothetical protein